MRIVLALLLCLIVVPKTMAEMTPIERQYVDNVAQKTFPGAPCAGKVNLMRVPLEKLQEITQTPTPGGAASLGNLDGTCTIYERDTIDDPYLECEVYVHEYGHLDDVPHQPSGIMSADADMDFGPCKAMEPVTTLKVAYALLKKRMGKYGSCTRANLDVWCDNAVHHWIVMTLHMGEAPKVIRTTAQGAVKILASRP